MRTVVLLISFLLFVSLLLFACPSPGRPPLFGPQAAARTELRYVSCMDDPPPIEVIDWPDADKLGNVLMHRSTVERVQNAYATLRRYTLEQYFKCLHVAEERGEQAVTVEAEP